MKVGLPGVGIGGVYYMLLVAWMPVRELRRMLQGRGDPRCWRLIGVQTALVAAILAALASEWWVLARLPALLADAAPVAGPAMQALSAVDGPGAAATAMRLEYLAPTVVMVPFAIVAAILAGLRLLRLLVHRATPAALPIAPLAATGTVGPDRSVPDQALGNLVFAPAAYAAGLGRAGDVARTPDR